MLGVMLRKQSFLASLVALYIQLHEKHCYTIMASFINFKVPLHSCRVFSHDIGSIFMNQREVWDSIADEWNKYRQKPHKEVQEFLQNKKGLILDLACGSGRNFAKIDGTIIGVDFSARMARLAINKSKRTKINACSVQGDALGLPFKDGSFDAVLFANAFHNIKWNKRKDVLEEIVRVSKDGAQVFISVWNRDQTRFAHAQKELLIPWRSKGKTYWRYYCLYSKDELGSLLRKYFANVRVFGSKEKAFKKYPKNIIAVARVAK